MHIERQEHWANAEGKTLTNIYNVFSLEMCGTIATIRICRAAAANAVPVSGWRELRTTIEAANANGARFDLAVGKLSLFLSRRRHRRSRFRSEMREALNALALAENMTCPQLAPSV